MEDLTKKHFDVMDGGVALVIFIALQYVFYFMLSFFPGILSNYVAYVVLSILLESTFALAAILIALARKKPILEATTLSKKVNWAIIGFCAIISLASIILFSDLSNAFSCTLEIAGFTSVLSDVAITNVGTYLISIVAVCAVPAFCEELLFRGVVLNSFRGVSKWLGIFVSGFTFMLMHGNPDQTIHQLLLGIVLAYIVWETKNLWVSIIIHFFNNFIAITLSFALNMMGGASAGSSGESTPISVQNLILMWILGLAMAAVGIVLIIWLTKYIKKQSEKANRAPAENAEVLVDGEPVQTEVTISKDQADTQTQNGEEQPATTQAEQKQKPSQLSLVFTIASYVAFAGYFVYEWLSVLIKGLGS